METQAPLFQLHGVSERARAGKLFLRGRKIPTPMFMPVGTRATVKMLTQEDLETLGYQLILGNTYHLYLKPGSRLIRELGGLHKFMGWERAILTDSGGFQVFSLSGLNKITAEGVHFRSHIDGSRHFFSPQTSMEVQRDLGSDIVMMFDDCPPLPCSPQRMEEAINRTLHWGRICRDFPLDPHQNLFAIIQGGLDPEMRKYCYEELQHPNFKGYALGGLSVGEPPEQRHELCQAVTSHLPPEKPRYLMGVGTPIDILDAVSCGIDIFDCVLPTRNARNGQALTWSGVLNIKNERFKKDQKPLCSECHCRVCQRYSRSYIRHLYTVGEYLAGQLLSYHNLFFYRHLVSRAREEILDNNFESFYKYARNRYLTGV